LTELDGPDPRLSAFLDGETDEEETAAISEMVAQSVEARNQLEELRQVRQRVRDLPLLDPPADVWRLLAGGSSLAPRRRTRSRAQSLAVGAVASIAFWAAVFSSDNLSASVTPEVGSAVSAHASVLPGDLAPDFGVNEMPGHEVMPEALPGMELIRLDRSGSMTHAMYSDGSLEISVFEQPGRVKWEALPPGEPVTLGRAPAWQGEIDGYEVLVVERRRTVYIIVAEPAVAMLDKEMASDMGDSMPGRGDPSFGDRLGRAADQVVEVFGFRG